MSKFLHLKEFSMHTKICYISTNVIKTGFKIISTKAKSCFFLLALKSGGPVINVFLFRYRFNRMCYNFQICNNLKQCHCEKGWEGQFCDKISSSGTNSIYTTDQTLISEIFIILFFIAYF